MPWSHSDDDPHRDPQLEGCDLHPDYCRVRCKSLRSRMSSRHADRMGSGATSRFGTCGDFAVFQEKEADDAGITEFFDDAGDVVGAVDDRESGKCRTFGTVPTCTTTWRSFPRATVGVRLASSTGPVDDSALKLELSFAETYLEDCYESALWQDPTVRGALEVVPDKPVADGGATRWKVASAKLDGASAALVACSLPTFEKIGFSIAKATDVHVVADFIAKPEHEATK